MALVAEGGEPLKITGARVADNFFTLLGTGAAVGRTLCPVTASPGRERVAVIADGLWRQRFGGDPGVIGRSVLVDQVAHEVVGVMPPRLRGAGPAHRTLGAAPLRAGHPRAPHHVLARARPAARRRHRGRGVAGTGIAGPRDASRARASRRLGPYPPRGVAAGHHHPGRPARAHPAARRRRAGAAARRRQPRHAGARPLDRAGARARGAHGHRRLAAAAGAPAAGRADRARRGRGAGRAGSRAGAAADRWWRGCLPKCRARPRLLSTAACSSSCWRRRSASPS